MATHFQYLVSSTFLWLAMASSYSANAQETHQRPMLQEIRAECIHGMLVVIQDLGFGPMCGFQRNRFEVHALKFEASSQTIAVELSEKNEGWGEHPERCHAWGEISRSIAIPSVPLAFFAADGTQVKEWKLSVNDVQLKRQYVLSQQWDPETRQMKPTCTRQ